MGENPSGREGEGIWRPQWFLSIWWPGYGELVNIG